MIGKDLLLVAEIGNNHEGSFERGMEMVRAAAAGGAGAVKFQTFRTEAFIRPTDESRFRRLKGFELTHNDFFRLSELAHSLGLLFISTPLDLESARFLEPLVDAYKVASGDITFYPLIEFLARTGKPVIISTGASELSDIETAVRFFRSHEKVPSLAALLHCVSSYPAPVEQVNLLSIHVLQEKFSDLGIGYSDHTVGIEACVAAVVLGARIIEKHFTLDKALSDFPDHKISADPWDLRELATRLNEISAMLGSRSKTLQPCERSMPLLIRRSVALKESRAKGHRLEPGDFVCLRPGTGIPPGREDEIIGRMLAREYQAGELLQWCDLIESGAN